MGKVKIPIYWRHLWEPLTDAEVGILMDCVFLYSKTGERPKVSSRGKEVITLRPEAQKVLERMFEDLEYQKTHKHAFKKPEDVKEIRNSEEYRIWRTAVFERDSFTCQLCRKVGGKLNAHHIKPFAKCPDLRTDINNGITLCEECHKRIHKKEKAS